jgi:antitoxin PrlF
MIISQVTSKGQTTIPAAVREALGLKSQDRLIYELGDGQVVIRALKGNLFQHRGTVRASRQPEDHGEIRRAVKARVAKRAAGR